MADIANSRVGAGEAADTSNSGSPENAEYAKQFGIETPDWPSQAAQES
jgi:hypothetical protein